MAMFNGYVSLPEGTILSPMFPKFVCLKDMGKTKIFLKTTISDMPKYHIVGYPLVNKQKTIENGHRNRGFSH